MAGPVVLRIKLRYDDVETMVQRFAPNVGKSGIFLPTKSLQPVGAEVKFELRLATEEPVLVGLGRVKLAKPPDPDDPKATFGMSVELMRVTRESRDLILRILERRRELKLPEIAIPQPSDIDAARRSADLSLPVAVPVEAVPTPILPVDSKPESFTAPRRASGPVPVAKVAAVAPLAPEAPRRRRPKLDELIERASGPIAMASEPELDADVDVAAVLARARALAGGDLDSELDALRESASAPLEISIDAASAELARQLGGVAVRRGWAPPPEVKSESPPVPEPTPEPEAPPPALTIPDAAISDEELRTPAMPAEALTQPGVEPELPAPDPEPLEIEPEQIDDEIHQLADDDFEELEEQTQIGALGVDPAAFEEHAFDTRPALEHEAIAARLDAELAEAEAQADDDDWGFGDSVVKRAPLEQQYRQDYIHRFESEAIPADATIDAEEIEDFEILAEADAGDADLLAAHGEHDVSQEVVPDALVERPSHSDFAARLDLGDDLGDDSDFYPAIALPSDGTPQSVDARLAKSAGHALAALASFDDIDDRNDLDDGGSTSYTLADEPDPSEFDDEPSGVVDVPLLHQFDSSDIHELVTPIPGAAPTPGPTKKRRPDPRSDHDLESALEALDVDLDDLSVPHVTANPTSSTRSKAPSPVPALAKTPSSPHRQPRAPRASSDDGVLIDFDDFEDDENDR